MSTAVGAHLYVHRLALLRACACICDLRARSQQLLCSLVLVLIGVREMSIGKPWMDGANSCFIWLFLSLAPF